ncbi:hypothetical protein VNI00_008441 [Paramarasmius palmivorus]|uniref:Uncharacterized protein n=1 Tax=Paramarasmius palmivorus TaxID=297713 RepID=A0AAW0CZ17_9AGAR
MILDDFPEAARSESGSISCLKQVIHRHRQNDIDNLEKLKAYNRAFRLEVNKLMEEPVIVNNYHAVQYYLSGLNEYWRRRLFEVMGNITREKIKSDQSQSKKTRRRHDDPWRLEDVMNEMENLMASEESNVYMKMNDLSLADMLIKDSLQRKPSQTSSKSSVQAESFHVSSSSTYKRSKALDRDLKSIEKEVYKAYFNEYEVSDDDGDVVCEAYAATLQGRQQELDSLRETFAQVDGLVEEVQSIKQALDDLPGLLQASWLEQVDDY